MAQYDDNDIISHFDDSLGHSNLTLDHNDGTVEHRDDSKVFSEVIICHSDDAVDTQGYHHKTLQQKFGTGMTFLGTMITQ